MRLTVAIAARLMIVLAARTAAAADAPGVSLIRAPEKGIQPQLVVDSRGKVHLLYFRGDQGHGDLFYVVSDDGGRTFSKPLAVNSTPGSAIAAGNIRGAHLTLGKNDRPIVAWMGSDKAKQASGAASSPMMVTRLADGGAAFEKEQNVMGAAAGLDGGGSVAADSKGHVFVVWHARGGEQEGETNRCVWIATSRDEGRTFGEPMRATKEETGACGCCGMRALVDGQGRLLMAYRAAKTLEQRDMFLLTRSPGSEAKGTTLQAWSINACPMSSAGFAANDETTVVAWETAHQVYWGRVGNTGELGKAIAAPGNGRRRFPAIAVDAKGNVLLAWTDGVTWGRGGKVSYAIFNSRGTVIERKENAGEVPAWSLVSAAALPGRGFVVAH